jgi:L-asparaginase
MIPFVLESDSRAVIIEGFGSGNLPIKGEFSFLPFVESCIESNRLVLIASQAPYDKVDLTKYENGKIMLDAGAIDTADMTTEAIITKLMHALAYHDSNAAITDLFKRSIAGEISL